MLRLPYQASGLPNRKRPSVASHGAVCLLLFGLGSSQSAGQSVPSDCDPTAFGARQPGDVGYQERRQAGPGSTNRCEGTYTPEIDDEQLYLSGFYESFADFDPESGAPLTMRWATPDNGTTYLTVHSVLDDIAYRMDAEVAMGSTSFDWPTEVLAALGLERFDLTPMAFSLSDVPLYYPLSVSQGDASGTRLPEGYELVVVPTTRLIDVEVALYRVDAAGRKGEVAIDGPRSLDEGDLFITREPIVIGIPKLPEPGVYAVEVVGYRENDIRLPAFWMWFYNAAAARGGPR